MYAPLLAFLHTSELLIILAIVVLVFGVGKIPELGRSLGSGIRNFKTEISGGGQEPRSLDVGAAAPAAPRDVTDQHHPPSAQG